MFQWRLYFSFGARPRIDLDPKTLFGATVIPEKTSYIVFRLVPINDNRVLVFFEESDKLFYAFYELDDLTAHVKNGSARLLQSLNSQEKHEVKYADGSDAYVSDHHEDLTWKDGKLMFGDKELSGIDMGARDWNVSYSSHKTHPCARFIQEGSVEVHRCVAEKNASFVRFEGDSQGCSYAVGSRDFTYVQLLSTEDFKINHSSTGYGVRTSAGRNLPSKAVLLMASTVSPSPGLIDPILQANVAPDPKSTVWTDLSHLIIGFILAVVFIIVGILIWTYFHCRKAKSRKKETQIRSESQVQKNDERTRSEKKQDSDVEGNPQGAI